MSENFSGQFNTDNTDKIQVAEKNKKILQAETERAVRIFTTLSKLEDRNVPPEVLKSTAKTAVTNISLHDLETAQRIVYALIDAKKDSIADEDKD